MLVIDQGKMRPESHERLGIYLRHVKIISVKLLHKSLEEMSGSLDMPRIFRYESVECIPRCLLQCLYRAILTAEHNFCHGINPVASNPWKINAFNMVVFPDISQKLANSF